MAKKDKKSKTAEQKARVAAKQNRKATQKEKKAKAKGGDDSDAEDVDLQAVLEEYSRQVCVLYIEYESLASPLATSDCSTIIVGSVSSKPTYLTN